MADEFKKNKVRVLFVDCFGNYSFHDFQNVPQACTWFRHAISRTDCFLCDMRFCGDLENLASYKNYKHILIKGELTSLL